jgi:hypothetical protein
MIGVGEPVDPGITPLFVPVGGICRLTRRVRIRGLAHRASEPTCDTDEQLARCQHNTAPRFSCRKSVFELAARSIDIGSLHLYDEQMNPPYRVGA